MLEIVKSNEFLVLFCHCKQEANGITIFGDPLWVKVTAGETVKEVKLRVWRILQIPKKEFNQWRIALHSYPNHLDAYLKDKDEILSKFSRRLPSGRFHGSFIGDSTSFIALVSQDTMSNHQTSYWKHCSIFSKCLSCTNILHE